MKKLINFYSKRRRTLFKACLIMCSLLFFQHIQAQIVKQDRFAGIYKWKVTLQTNFMDTNFDKENPVNTENWSMLPFPSKIAIERHIIDNLGFEASFSMNKIEKDKNVNGLITNDELNFFSIDGMFKYSLGGLFNIPIVDPYLGVGMGYMELDSNSKTTFNYGGGLNLWLADTGLFKDYVYTRDRIVNRLGLNLEIVGKKNLDTGPGSNLQLSAGVFFVF